MNKRKLWSWIIFALAMLILVGTHAYMIVNKIFLWGAIGNVVAVVGAIVAYFLKK